MRKRPFLCMACFFLLGILWRTNGTIVYPIGMLALLIYSVNRLQKQKYWLRLIGRSILLLSLFMAGYIRVSQELAFRQEYIGRLTDGDAITIQGEIYKKEFKNQQYLFYLKDCVVVGSSGKTPTNSIIAYFKEDDYSIGQILLLKGKVKLFSEARNEGNFDMRAYYLSQKIDFGVASGKVKKVTGKRNGFSEKMYQLKMRLEAVFEVYLNKEDAGVLSVMLLGDKSSLDTEVRSLYQKAGISHILAISGLHVSLIGLGLYKLLRKFRCQFKLAGVIATSFLVAYGIMTGMGISTKRAIGMFLLTMTGIVIERSYDLLNGLGVMALYLLTCNPFLFGYSGFAFSFMAIIGVGVTGKILCEFGKQLKKGKKKGKQRNGLQNTILMSLGIQLTTLPLVAYYYFEIPVYAILINLIVIPPLSIIVVTGLLGGVTGLVTIHFPVILFLPCKIILSCYTWICGMCQKLPYSQYVTGQPSKWRMIVYYSILGLGLYWIHRITEQEYNGEKKVKKRRVLVWGVLLMVLLIWKTPSDFELDVLDVGQGDGIYLQTSNGVPFFFDGGSSDIKEVGKYRILPFLKSKGASHISYWFVSHGDSDHIAGLLEILEDGYTVNNLVLSEYMIRDEAYESLIAAAKKNDTQIISLKPGDCIASKNMKMTCLYPSKESCGRVEENRNALSQVILYEDKEFTGLFAGDLDAEGEKALCKQLLSKQEGETSIHYLKAVHHGSNSSNTKELFDTFSPEIITISCGLKNSYGHPGKEAVQRMEESGADIYETMQLGQLRIEADGTVSSYIKVMR